jgi:hypothetical protein
MFVLHSRIRTLTFALLGVLLSPFAFAESGVIGISVTLDKDKAPRVTIISTSKRNNVKNVTVPEAVKKIAAARGNHSQDFVGIMAADVPLSAYLPLLDAVAKNSWLDLYFVDGTTSDGISNNIRKFIEEAVNAEVE